MNMVSLGFRKKDDALLPKDNERSDIHNDLLKNVSYEAPGTPATVPTASPEDSVKSTGGSIALVVAPDDPPGTKMERVKSLEENRTQKSNDSGDSLRQNNQPNTHKDPPPSESLVNKVLGIMDYSCVSPGFGGEGSLSSSNSEFRPEWGVAPEDDDDDDVEESPEYRKTTPSTRSAASSSASSVSSAPNASTTSDPTSNKTTSKYYQKRHENFELVYKEKPKENTHKPNSKERNKGLLKKLKAMHIAPKETPHFYNHRPKKSKKATLQDQMTTQTTATADSETTAATTTTTERNRRRRMGTRIETTHISVPVKQDTPDKETPIADSKEPSVSPSHNPRLLSITKNLKKAFSKEGTPSSSSTTTTTTSTSEEVSPEPLSPRGFRRRAPEERRGKRQKPPTAPLETVLEEETEENDDAELKVPVPGGGFISDKDLIGEEVVEEIYNGIENEVEKERKEK